MLQYESRRLTREEEVELAKRIKRGCEDSFQELVTNNIPLVQHIADGFLIFGVERDDIVSAGLLGLMQAARRFDPIKNSKNKFSTYAAWWIKQKIRNEWTKQTIRLPYHVVDKKNRMQRFKAKYEMIHQREPSQRKLAEFMCLSKKQVNDLEFASAIAHVSLDAKTGECENTLHTLLTDNSGESDAHILCEEKKAIIFKELKRLKKLERTVILRRFGLNGRGSVQTLESIGKEFGVTREWIRQLQKRTLAHLRLRLTKIHDF